MNRLSTRTATQIARCDFDKGDYEEDWRSVEARYPEFSDIDVQEYLDEIKVAYRQAVFASYEHIQFTTLVAI